MHARVRGPDLRLPTVFDVGRARPRVMIADRVRALIADAAYGSRVRPITLLAGAGFILGGVFELANYYHPDNPAYVVGALLAVVCGVVVAMTIRTRP